MKTVRTAVCAVGSLLLVGGYFASQYASLWGDPASYTRSLDSSSVPVLALVLLVAMVVLAALPSSNGGEG